MTKPAFLQDIAETVERQEIDEDATTLAWEIVSLQPELDESEQRDAIVLILLSLIALAQGSTRVPMERVGTWHTTHLEGLLEVGDNAAAWLLRIHGMKDENRLETILGVPGDAKPLIMDQGCLYHHRTHLYEVRLSAKIRARLDGSVVEIGDTLEDVLHRPVVGSKGDVVLDPAQIRAVTIGASHPLAIVTGGPGTGKTSIVLSILRLLLRHGVVPERIALAAPTGKAANRLGESIFETQASIAEPSAADDLITEVPRPQTLHRLLQYSKRTGGFAHGERNPLIQKWIIVDEASMIDLVLMERLLSSVGPDAHLVLIGDAEQLPSVDTGTILRDLVPDLGVDVDHVARLTHSHRMDASDPAGSAIFTAAQFVREGDASMLQSDGLVTQELDSLRFTGAEWVTLEPDSARQTLFGLFRIWEKRQLAVFPELDQLASKHVYQVEDGAFREDDVERLNQVFEHLSRSRILCLTRVFDTGAEFANRFFHRRLAERSGAPSNTPFIAGTPVLMLHNDYERNLFNGDQGVIVRADLGEDARLVVVFPDGQGYRAHHLSSLVGRLGHAFAMTVHKSQGSEFDDVLLILPVVELPLLTREILYTGLTRSRRSIVVAGSEEALENGTTRQISRFSGIRERVSAAQ